MKTLKLLVLATVAFAAVTLHAQPANMSSLASESALRISLIGQVSQGYLGFDSVSQVPGGATEFSVGFGLHETAQSIASGIDQLLSTQYITVANPKDGVSAWADLVDIDGDELFYGEGWSEIFPNRNGGYTLPTIGITLALAYYVPIQVGDDIASAEMFVKNAQGYTEDSVPLTVSNGKLYFQSDLAGTGILVLTSTTGQTISYDLGNGGGQIILPTVPVNTSSAFDGIQSVTFTENGQLIERDIESISGVGENIAFEINAPLATNYSSATMYVYTTEGALPIGYWIKYPGEANYSFYYRPTGLPFTEISIIRGVTYVIPEWDPAEFSAPDPVANDGGKG